MVYERHFKKDDAGYHKCNLPGESFNVIATFIDTGLFVDFRRRVKRLTMISKHHPYTRAYAPSINRLKQEEKEHLIEHYTTIHPLSMFSIYFNLYASVVFILNFLFGPVVYAITDSLEIQSYIMLPVNITVIMLIIITFLTGVYDEKNNTVKMNSGDIAKTYLKSYFFLDLLTVLPQLLRLNYITHVISDTVFNYLFASMVIIRYLRYIWCLKVLRVARLYFGVSTIMYRIMRLILNLCIINIVFIYILFILLPQKGSYTFKRFLLHAEGTMRIIMLIEPGYEFSQGENGLLISGLTIIFICAGFIYHLVMLSEVMSIWSRLFSAENKQSTVYESITAYTKYKALPVTLRDRIYLFLEFKYKGQFYKESALMKLVPAFLRKEIMLFATRHTFDIVPLFQNIPHFLMKKIRVNLCMEVYLPGDVVIKAGNQGGSMYFLAAGTLLVTSEKDEEICQLRDGSYFGEAGLVANMVRFVNVIAVTPCEIYKLKRDKFTSILKNYPELYKDIEDNLANKVSIAMRANHFEAGVIY